MSVVWCGGVVCGVSSRMRWVPPGSTQSPQNFPLLALALEMVPSLPSSSRGEVGGNGNIEAEHRGETQLCQSQVTKAIALPRDATLRWTGSQSWLSPPKKAMYLAYQPLFFFPQSSLARHAPLKHYKLYICRPRPPLLSDPLPRHPLGDQERSTKCLFSLSAVSCHVCLFLSFLCFCKNGNAVLVVHDINLQRLRDERTERFFCLLSLCNYRRTEPGAVPVNREYLYRTRVHRHRKTKQKLMNGHEWTGKEPKRGSRKSKEDLIFGLDSATSITLKEKERKKISRKKKRKKKEREPKKTV